MDYLKKFLPIILPGLILTWVIFKIEPPKSITQASVLQILLFFIPLFLLIVFLLNLYLRFLVYSAIMAIGIIILLLLQALNSLNIVSAALVIIACALLLKSIQRPKNKIPLAKIPKLGKLAK